MKRKFSAFALVFLLLFSAIVLQVNAVTYLWQGEWQTNWGKMYIIQEGNIVTGTYEHDEGRIAGTVVGNKFIGTWSEAPSYAPDHDAGDMELEMSADGETFTGKWRYGSSGAWGEWEGGKRLTEVIAASEATATPEPTETPEPESDIYSEASEWAIPELEKASEYELIPNSLVMTDMTRPITREEFAELSLRLYEKATGVVVATPSYNPFTDTDNYEIIKAYNLGITKGYTATTFEPNKLTTREEVATMLSRAIRIMAPNSDYSTVGAPSFIDQKDISPWALEHVLYMSKLGVIKGTNGKFIPKATTSAQEATGYATTTREQAIAMSVRTFEQSDEIMSNVVTKPTATPKPSATPQPTAQPQASTSIVGDWIYSNSSGNVGLAIMYEFKANGTFTRAIASVAGSSYNSTAFEGKYRIEGNTITFYNQMKSTGYASSWDEIWRMANSSIKDIPVEDSTRTFSISNNILTIDETIFEPMTN